MADLSTLEAFCEALGKYDIEWQVTKDGLRCYNLVKEDPDNVSPFCPITALCYLTTGVQYSVSEVDDAAEQFIPIGTDLDEARQDIITAADTYAISGVFTGTTGEHKAFKALRKHLKITEKGGTNENV